MIMLIELAVYAIIIFLLMGVHATLQEHTKRLKRLEALLTSASKAEAPAQHAPLS